MDTPCAQPPQPASCAPDEALSCECIHMIARLFIGALGVRDQHIKCPKMNRFACTNSRSRPLGIAVCKPQAYDPLTQRCLALHPLIPPPPKPLLAALGC